MGHAAHVQGGPKIGTLFVFLITSSNIDQFSNFFTARIRRENCSNTATKDQQETTCSLSQLLSKVTVTSCSFYLKCSMHLRCYWTTHS